MRRFGWLWGGGGGGCLLRKRIGLLFYLLFLFVIENLYLDATFVFSLSFPGVCSALLNDSGGFPRSKIGVVALGVGVSKAFG